MKDTARFVLILCGTLTAAVLAVSSPIMAADTECRNITPFQAYTRASQVGWKFKCSGEQVAGRVNFLPLASGELACVGKTGLDPLKPVSSYRAFFFERDGVNNSGGKLAGGWRIKAYTVSGGQYTRISGNYHAVAFEFDRDGFNKTFNIKLRTFVLAKKGGDCSKALDEAFPSTY